MDVQLTTMELEMMMADVELDEHGMVDYHQFLPKCTKLLVTLKAARLALASEHQKEVRADERALGNPTHPINANPPRQL